MATEPLFDALCIGNAICDVLAHVEDDFLVREKLAKGSMRLVDMNEALRLYDRMGPATRVSGGSAGNTAAGIASLGGQPAFVGKVAADELGDSYRHDMRAAGVHFETPTSLDGAPTARSMILITPDGERTMNTYLGACVELSPSDVVEETVAAAAFTYMEGYLWDPPLAKNAFLKAAEVAHAHKRHVALTLSDAFCVDRYRDEFLGLMREGTVDLLFANEHELRALYQTADLDTAIDAVRGDCAMTCLTLGENGAMAIARAHTCHVPGRAVDVVVDLTGAGDLCAGGVLHALARGHDLRTALDLGNLAAAAIIRHLGPRPQTSLKALAEQDGLAVS